MRHVILVGVAVLTVRPGTRLTAQAPRIADNSFLLEEAYNQERGVVQHISVFQRSLRRNAWAYAFTQEWPLFGQTSQLSFTLPVERAGARTGVGDVALNYRYQLGGGAGAVAAAPRASVVLPTGDESEGFGAGAAAFQLNLPVSVALGGAFVSHWNAGGSVTPAARNAAGQEARTTDVALGASVIWLARPTFNVMLEAVWSRVEEVSGPDQRVAREGWHVSPGVRWAHNFASGLQIVPGIAFPIGLGGGAGERGVLVYLSLEHPFRRQER